MKRFIAVLAMMVSVNAQGFMGFKNDHMDAVRGYLTYI